MVGRGFAGCLTPSFEGWEVRGAEKEDEDEDEDEDDEEDDEEDEEEDEEDDRSPSEESDVEACLSLYWCCVCA